MDELKKILNYAEWEPAWTVELYEKDGKISVCVSFENCSSAPINRVVNSPEQIGEAVADCIKETASWM